MEKRVVSASAPRGILAKRAHARLSLVARACSLQVQSCTWENPSRKRYVDRKPSYTKLKTTPPPPSPLVRQKLLKFAREAVDREPHDVVVAPVDALDETPRPPLDAVAAGLVQGVARRDVVVDGRGR